MQIGRCHRKGFTLIEMLIVGSLIVVFAGLAMIGAQRMYDDSRRKAMFDETKSIGTSLSWAHQDLGFYPRIGMIGMALSLIRIQNTGTPVSFIVRPGLDALGLYPNPLDPKLVFNVSNHWKGPYMTVTEARARMSQGSHGICTMRLPDSAYNGFPDIANEDPSLIKWPTDTWGNPYVFYQVAMDPEYVTGNNPKGLRLVKDPSEQGDFFTAVVSYGQNNVPGGTPVDEKYALPGFPDQALYVKGDLKGGNADYTLKSAYAAYGPAKIDPTDKTAMAQLGQSIESKQIDPQKIGIIDTGSDDIFFRL